MQKTYRIELSAPDIGQVLDGLKIRAETWEKTAHYLRTEKMPEGELFIIEECSSPDEARAVAEHYRTIIQTIREQMEKQRE